MSHDAAIGQALAPTTDATELQLRRDLAACYRLVAHFGWDDLIYTHISMRLPGDADRFLINPYGLMFSEIRASDLVVVDASGRPAQGMVASVNPAGFIIHSAIHLARKDAHCVIHLHTHNGVAVSAMEEGLLPLNQSAISAAADLAYHDFEGPALNAEERERLVADLGTKNSMILRNHGTLAVGATAAQAFHRIYFLEWSCKTQVRALGAGRPLRLPTEASIEATREATLRHDTGELVDTLEWPALLRLADRIDPTYRD